MQQATLHIQIDDVSAADAEELDRQAAELLDELNAWDDLDAGQPAASQESSPGSKGLAPDWDLLVKVLSASGVSALVAALGAFLNRNSSRSLTLEINGNTLQVSHITQEKQDELIAWFQIQSGLSLNGGK